MKIAVVGAYGRMGQAMASGLAECGFDIVARLGRGDPITSATLGPAEAAIEFTHPDVTLENTRALIDAGVHPVVGTTGWTEEKYARVRHKLESHPHVGTVIAPNFSVSAVLLTMFAAYAAPFFPSVEIIEMHHPDKVDAPSGTARATATAVSQARQAAGCGPMPDATVEDPHGARGAQIEGIPVHAVRLRGLTAHQEVLLGGQGEQLVLRADSFDRSSFVAGVAAALHAVPGRPGLTVGLENIMLAAQEGESHRCP